MAWKVSSVVDERFRFVFEHDRHEQSMKQLCASFGISRETGYVWLRRFQRSGLWGLQNLNRAPRRHPNQTAPAIEEAVLELRQAHMGWGPRKLKWRLERDWPGRDWPATSTIGEIIKRAGLVSQRKKRRKTEPYSQPLAHAVESNRVWCADFKGWFRTGDGSRVDPLTISDAWSRYLLRCQAVEKTDTERVRAIFEAAFREYGIPQAIRTDNGPPFASLAIGGLSRLAVWWIKLGIQPERIEAGHPEQNGRHERIHRTMDEELLRGEDWRSQQREMDAFRNSYNHVRPHEALGMETPASVYQPSERNYPEKVPEVQYPDGFQVRTIKAQGHFRWKQKDVFLSQALWGEPVGILPIEDGIFTIYFARVPLARFDEKNGKIYRLPKHPRQTTSASGSGQARPEAENKMTLLPQNVAGNGCIQP